MKSTIFITLLAFLLMGCGGTKKPNLAEVEETIDAEEMDLPSISAENIESILSSIPHPVELSSHIQETGIEYSKDYLNEVDNYENYNSSYKKALNFGIYGTDLGYTNLYTQIQDGLSYLNVVGKLADDLNLGQFFDFETLKRLNDSGNNLDSLLMITNQNFDKINNYFIERNNASLSTLILTGGWIESLHITNQVLKTRKGNKELRERIGEQKIVLDNIVLVLSIYSEHDEQIAGLLDDIKRLEHAYENVHISYKYEESTSKVVDGVLEIESTSTSQVEITDEDIAKITEVVEDIRNKIIS